MLWNSSEVKSITHKTFELVNSKVCAYLSLDQGFVIKRDNLTKHFFLKMSPRTSELY
jgi:hypothetical protein